MAARLSSKRLPGYSLQFKVGAVKLTEIPGMEVQVVAGARGAPGGARAPKKSHPVLLRKTADVFAFIQAQGRAFPVARIGALLGVSRAGFYAWRRRGWSARRERDRVLARTIARIF